MGKFWQDAMDSSSSDRVQFCLCCMCGLPGSGKSTICEQLNLKLQDSYLVLTMNYDKILLDPNSDTIKLWQSLDSGQSEDGESNLKSARAQVLNLVEFLIQQMMTGDVPKVMRETPKPGYINEDVWSAAMAIYQENLPNCNFENTRQVLFLLDDNMYFWSMRYEYYKIARLYRTGFCEIYVKSSLEKAKERNKSRHGQDHVDDDVIERISKKLEVPDSSKNAWEKYCSVLNTDNDINLIGAIQIIEEAFANPAHPSPEVDAEERLQSQTVCSANFIHQLDLILRKCVSKTMMKGKNSSEDLKKLGKQVLSVKENLLSLLKKGELCLPESIKTDVKNSSKDENSDVFKYVENLFICSLKSCQYS